jgi:hypothetical protein
MPPQYVVPPGMPKMRIEVIGQRLLTGRLCIAQAALVYARVLHLHTLAYGDTKQVPAPRPAPLPAATEPRASRHPSPVTRHPSPIHPPPALLHPPRHSLQVHVLGGMSTLSKLPHLVAHFDAAGAALGAMERATALVEERLAACLREGTIPGDALVQDIGICKIKVRCWLLLTQFRCGCHTAGGRRLGGAGHRSRSIAQLLAHCPTQASYVTPFTTHTHHTHTHTHAAPRAPHPQAIDVSIETCHRLQQELGSFALMEGSGFEHIDMLQCCKFAEGDSRILMQKITRDKVGDSLLAAHTNGTEDRARQGTAGTRYTAR